MSSKRRNGRGRITGAVVVIFLVVTALVAPAVASAAPGQPVTNTTLTGRTSKLSLRLQALADPQVQAFSAADQSRAVGLAETGAGSLMTRPGGRIVVRIRFTDMSTATLDAVRAAGVSDLSLSIPDLLANGVVDPTDFPALVAVPGVAAVVEEITPMVGSPGATLAVAKAAGSQAVTNAVPPCPTGLVSEGDVQLKADQARTNFAVNGAGVKVGILSDSYNSLGGAAADVAAAELPGSGNTCGFTTPVQIQADHSGADEGRAMAQIVHDIAPGSPLVFATAFNGLVDFANQIRALQAGGASVIVDDVSYFTEPMFQDGIIAKAVDDVVAAGVTYYSSAGNNTLTIGGHDVTSYESGAYRPTTCPAAVIATEGSPANLTCHDFNQGGSPDNGDTMTIAGNQRVRFSLSYSQPQGGVTTDLDLLMVNAATGSVLANSFNANLNTQDASEFINFLNPSASPLSVRLVVARHPAGDAGTPRFKFSFFPNGASSITSVQYNVSTGNDIVGPTVFGHNGATRAATVAAVAYNSPAPFAPEAYSSHGPLKKCWGPSTGTFNEVTGTYTGAAGAIITPCQTKTVDFAATDGGQNSFFGGGSPHRFYGTSAAAPHAAAVGALARQKFPCRTPDEILAAQRSSARAMTAPLDVVGSGMIDANAMLGALVACPPNLFTPVTPVRVADSRPATLVGAFATPWSGGTSRDVAVGGVSGIPIDAVAVVLNVTVTDTTGSSFLTLWPAGQPKPTASSLNWTPGRTIPNAVTVELGAGGLNAGKVSVYNLSGTVNVIIDVAGYYKAGVGDGFTSQVPTRLLDSRPATNVGAFATPWIAGMARDLTVAGAALVPSGADAVVLNVTVTDTTGPSFLTLWPTGAPRPTASNLNWTPGITIPNAVTVKLGVGGGLGKVSVFNQSGNVNVIIDVAGYYKAGTGKAFHPVNPGRVLDSRPATRVGAYSTPWGLRMTRPVVVGGLAGVPNGADSVVLNTTVTNTTGPSFLTVWPAGLAQPTASSLNWTPGLTIPNAVTVKLGVGANADNLSMFNLAGNVDVITDVAGWFG